MYVCCSDLLLAQCVSVEVYRAVRPEQRAAVHTRFGSAATDCSGAGDLFHLSAKQMLQWDIPVFQLQQMPPFIHGESDTKARGLNDNYIHRNQYRLPTGKSSNVLLPSFSCLIALEHVLSTELAYVFKHSCAVCHF